MTKKEAISLLTKQKAKLTDAQHLNDKTWVIQTASLIKDCFGEQSPEYGFIIKFDFSISWKAPKSKSWTEPIGTTALPQSLGQSDFINAQQQKINQVSKFIDNCIESIESKGLNKSLRKNFLQESDNASVISFLIFVGATFSGIGFYFGQLKYDRDNLELIQENKMLKDSLIQTSKLKSNNFNADSTMKSETSPTMKNDTTKK